MNAEIWLRESVVGPEGWEKGIAGLMETFKSKCPRGSGFSGIQVCLEGSSCAGKIGFRTALPRSVFGFQREIAEILLPVRFGK